MKRQLKCGDAYACDIGAGIGRVTKHLLLPHFKHVDVVEPCEPFVLKFRELMSQELEDGRVKDIFHVGANEMQFAAGRYDIVWAQWVLQHLTDDDLTAFIGRACRAANCCLVIKENFLRGTTCNDTQFDITSTTAADDAALAYS